MYNMSYTGNMTMKKASYIFLDTKKYFNFVLLLLFCDVNAIKFLGQTKKELSSEKSDLWFLQPATVFVSYKFTSKCFLLSRGENKFE